MDRYLQGAEDMRSAIAVAGPDPVRQVFADMQEQLSDHEKDVLLHDVGAMEAGAQSEAAAFDPNDPMGWVVRWLPEKLAAIDAKREAYKAWLEREGKRLDRQAEYLLYRWGREAEIEVGKQTQGDKTRSIDTPHGRIGFRKKAPGVKVEIVDEAVALAHAAEKCPKAIKATHKLLVSELKKLDTPLRGTRVVQTPGSETFFIGKRTLHQPALPTPVETKRVTAHEFFGKGSKQVQLCESCGKQYAEPGQKTCLGCQAHKDHTDTRR